MTLFNRSGQEFTGTVKTDSKGRPYYEYQTACHRCGGAGGCEQWAHTGWTCFECGGSGNKRMKASPLYTEEQLAKLNATQAKRQAKADAKRAVKAAERTAQVKIQAEAWMRANQDLWDGLCEFQFSGNPFLADMAANVNAWGCLSDKQAEAATATIAKLRAEKARAATAKYLGELGQRLELTITAEKIINISGPDRGLYGPRYLFLCRDQEGNAVVYKGNACAMPSEGQTVTIKATVVEHQEYRNVKQTIIGRPAALKAAA